MLTNTAPQHPLYHSEQSVWLFLRNIPRLTLVKLGPFVIESVSNPSAVCPKLPPSLPVYSTFHFSQLSPLAGPPPPARLVDGHSGFTVHRLVCVHRQGHGSNLWWTGRLWPRGVLMGPVGSDPQPQSHEGLLRLLSCREGYCWDPCSPWPFLCFFSLFWLCRSWTENFLLPGLPFQLVLPFSPVPTSLIKIHFF